MASDARRRAEEALAVCPRTPRGSALIHEDHLRALPAAPPDEGEAPALTGLEAALVGDRPAPQTAPTPEESRAALLALADAAPEPGTSFLAGAAPVAPHPAPTPCHVDHSTCCRCGRDTSEDGQVFVLCDPCWGATVETARHKFANVDLAALPVHFIALLPRGRIFMHPDTPKSGTRDPWPPAAPKFTHWAGAATKPDGER